jgi:hypothetical protein
MSGPSCRRMSRQLSIKSRDLSLNQNEVISDLKRKAVFVKMDMGVYMIDL